MAIGMEKSPSIPKSQSRRKLDEAAPHRRQGRVASRRTLPSRWLHRDKHGADRRDVVTFYNKRGTCEQYIKEGKGAINGRGRPAVHSPPTWFDSSLMRSPSTSATSCARWRRRSRPRTGHDDAQGEADQDRREGRGLCPLRRVPDGGGRHSEKPIRRLSAHDRGTATAADHVNCVRCSDGYASDRKRRERCVSMTVNVMPFAPRSRIGPPRRPSSSKFGAPCLSNAAGRAKSWVKTMAIWMSDAGFIEAVLIN